MQTKFEKLKISKQEYNFFLTLNSQERLDYMFDLYVANPRSVTAMDLGGFFSAIHEQLETEQDYDDVAEFEFPDGADRVDVMIDDDNIMIESNSLKAVRHVFSKFVESGFILRRDRETEKMFRKDKITRYLRVFCIVDQISGICFN
jgi:hypothetical protein